ncbi:MAG: hypothetical protein UX17_C0019G0010 [Parcubacteria group bacterium GW2011_GWC2_45_7]|nr:MAG: hypothetical protein UX17_C0019G0010 [Parcubacteria group bacterium GW2011_GWC2_45_7]
MAPGGVALGNQTVSPAAASAFFGYMLSTISILAQPAMDLVKLKLSDPKHLALLYFVVNTVAVWVLTRLALIIGVGISAFWWAGVLGGLLMLGQWFVWGALTKR